MFALTGAFITAIVALTKTPSNWEPKQVFPSFFGEEFCQDSEKRSKGRGGHSPLYTREQARAAVNITQYGPLPSSQVPYPAGSRWGKEQAGVREEPCICLWQDQKVQVA